MDNTGYRESVFNLFIIDAVAAEKAYTGFPNLIGSTPYDLFQDPNVESFYRKTDYVEGRLRHRPHCIDITQSIGCRNLAKPVGVIDDGREKVYGLDQGDLIRDLVDTCVFKTFNAYDDVLIGGYLDAAENIR
jgi:hypothetical protein